MVTRVLDRLVGHEPENRAYGIRLEVEAIPTRPVWWSHGAWLDQGDTGHCVGFASAGEAADSPVRVRGVTADYAHAWYYEIKDKRYDRWGREDGSSVNAGMRVGRDRGLWTGWRWCFGIDDVKRGIRVGPVVLGIPWRSGMFRADTRGIIQPTGSDEGGHAIRATGYTANLLGLGPHFRLMNSWGRSWGRNGYCYISADHLGELLADDGEAAVPLNRSLPPARGALLAA